MSETAANQLATLIAKLQAERQRHLEAVAQIDATFEEFGIAVGPIKKRMGRPRKNAASATSAKLRTAPSAAKTGTRRTRCTFEMNGQDSILGFVKRAGKKDTTTAEIVEHWKSEGRAGDGYTTLSLLVKGKKMKKEKIKGAKGSRYTAV